MYLEAGTGDEMRERAKKYPWLFRKRLVKVIPGFLL